MVKTFLAAAIPMAIVIWSLETRRLGRWPKVSLCSLGLLLLGVVGFVTTDHMFLGGEPWHDRSPWKEGLLLLTMLVGMAVRSLDEAIEIRRQRIAKLRKQGKLRRKPKLLLDRWDFSRPFLVSVPTFGGLLSQVGEQTLGWVVVVLAFQTGFFWQTILKKSEPKLEAE